MITGTVDSRRSTDGMDHARQSIQAFRQSGGVAFSDVLKRRGESQPLRFSAHAESRMKSRGIEVSEELQRKLEEAVRNAELKGARDTLLLHNDLAFIVNVSNRTVVTAMDGESTKENVFTNIDSAVIVS